MVPLCRNAYFALLNRRNCRNSGKLHRNCRRCFNRSAARLVASSDSGHDEGGQFDTVVCGSGIIGSSIAYHLSLLGHASNTLLLDIGGNDSNDAVEAVGLVSSLQSRQLPQLLVRRSQQLYRRLAADGHQLQLINSGSVHVARCHQRLLHYQRLASLSAAEGQHGEATQLHVVSIDRLLQLCPVLLERNVVSGDDEGKLVGGVWAPDDFCLSPARVSEVLTRLAVDAGVTLRRGATLSRVITDRCSSGSVRDMVTGVQLSDGSQISCRRVVNAAGRRARLLSQLADTPVRLPVLSCEHYRLVTGPLQALQRAQLPVLCDPDGRLTVRVKSEDGSALVAGFEPRCEPVLSDSVATGADDCSLDWDRMYTALLQQLMELTPVIGAAMVNAAAVTAETYSPDAHWTVGEAGETAGYFVAAGFGDQGTAAAGGIGQLMASWIINGYPPVDVHEMDVRRFLALHNNTEFLRRRMREVPSRCVRVPWPFAEFNSGRRLRTSPIFSRLKVAGAKFGAVMGYERPSYFEPSSGVSTTDTPLPPTPSSDLITTGKDFHVARTDTFYCPRWFERVGVEYAACRERVAICDYSSFTKIDLLCGGDGKELVQWLQKLCSNDVDIAVGNIVHTGMQNELGGYENDCSLARIAHNHYMVICPTVQHARCQWWLRCHAPRDGSVVINDITSLFTALCLMGPLSRELLSEVTDTDLDPRRFPFFTFKEIDVGMVSGVRAMNMTHTGELGWVLYVPNEFALYVYDLLVQRGRNFGLSLAGYLAMRSLRVEKFYAFWGQDLGTSATPLECGRAFRVKFAKNIDFIGRSALERQKKEGVRRLYVHFTLQQHNPYTDPWPCGNEPIFRDGRPVGLVTTTAFGYSLGKMVCLGFVQNLSAESDDSLLADSDFVESKSWEKRSDVVTNDFVMRGNYQISIGQRLFSAKPSLVSSTLPGRSVTDTTTFHQKRYQPTQHTPV